MHLALFWELTMSGRQETNANDDDYDDAEELHYYCF